MKFISIICLLLAVGVNSELQPGTCPDATPFAELEVAPYLGRWYEERRIEMIFEGNQDCNMAIYTDLGDGVVEVHNTGRTEAGYFDDIYGTAVVIAPGVLEVSFPGYPSSNYTVLDTDYTTYSAVYDCDQYEENRALYGWILAREVPLPDDVIESVLATFTANGIDVSLFSQTYQGDDCPYFPESSPPPPPPRN